MRHRARLLHAGGWPRRVIGIDQERVSRVIYIGPEYSTWLTASGSGRITKGVKWGEEKIQSGARRYVAVHSFAQCPPEVPKQAASHALLINDVGFRMERLSVMTYLLAISKLCVNAQV